MSRRDIRLGFVSARSAYRKGNVLWVEAGVGRVIERIGERFPNLSVTMSAAPEHFKWFDHPLELPPGRLRELPYLPSVVGGAKQTPVCQRIIGEVERQSDALIIQLPFAAPAALLPARGPRVYHVCADVFEIVRTTPRYTGWRRIPTTSLAWGMDKLYRTLAQRKDARIVAHGREIFERYSSGKNNGCTVVSATLYDKEILSVPRTRAEDGTFRILFVGYLRHEKGIGTLLEAFERVRLRVPGAELHLVGAMLSDDRGGITPDVRARLEKLLSEGRVHFLGPKNFGPELFECFANADVLTLPSLNEGTPRVLVEARAMGCPVVASRVGGIPTSVQDGVDGMLVPPADAPALEEALFKMATDKAWREKLVAAGIETARRYTVEKFSDAIADEVERALSAGGR